ncbi:MAG: hypothetical protein COA73_12000 [Candidatus Hydrogenedentota bacterium]|nr:MAG: hypothetical protein COA73_12000 [Candidatus Hydrogenedentota bacterium]
MNQREYTFRMDFMPVFLFVYIVGSVLGALAIVSWVSLDPGLDVERNVMLETVGFYIMLFSPPYSILCAVVMNRYFTYIVSEDGIRGQNLLGKSQFVPWKAIRQINPIHIGNLRYARIVSETEKLPLWFPLFLNDEKIFARSLQELAPEGNAIRIVANR